MPKKTEEPTISEAALSFPEPTRRPVPVMRRVADGEYDYWLRALTDAEHHQALRLMTHPPKSMLSSDKYVTAVGTISNTASSSE